MLRSHRGDPWGTTRKHCLGLCLPGVGKEEAEEIGLGGRGPRGLGGSSGKGRGTAPGWVASSSAPRGCPFPAEVPGWLGLCSHTQGPLCVWHGRRWGCAPTHSFAGGPWSSPAVGSYDIIANLPVVIDNRSGVIRTGFTGDPIPTYCFPNLTGSRARVHEAGSPGGGPLHRTGGCWPCAAPWSLAWCGTGMRCGSTSTPRSSHRPSPRSIPCV